MTSDARAGTSLPQVTPQSDQAADRPTRAQLRALWWPFGLFALISIADTISLDGEEAGAIRGNAMALKDRPLAGAGDGRPDIAEEPRHLEVVEPLEAAIEVAVNVHRPKSDQLATEHGAHPPSSRGVCHCRYVRGRHWLRARRGTSCLLLPLVAVSVLPGWACAAGACGSLAARTPVTARVVLQWFYVSFTLWLEVPRDVPINPRVGLGIRRDGI
jgi:hypothetical protein